jgi:hypothetical protein
MKNEDTEKCIWLTAYLRGLTASAPDEASEVADCAVEIYRVRWAEEPAIVSADPEREAAFQAASRKATEIIERRADSGRVRN